MSSIAQEATKPKIEIIGRAQTDRIVLRWVANDARAWQYANKYGMQLERYTVLRDGKALASPEKKIIPTVFKPLPLAEWESLSETDDYALVAAQALYGETFEMTENFSSDMSKAIHQTKEIEQRHLFAMFAADHSKKVADASGLYYEDLAVNKNEKYLYTISCLVPKKIMKVDTGHVYLGLKDYFPLPKPEGLRVEVKDTVAMLSWEGRRFKDFYNSFVVERSVDGGKTFRSISDLPIVNAAKDGREYPEFIFKGDTLGQYDVKYIYRVKGLNPFGEISPSSDTASIVCHKKLQHVPRIVAYKINEEGHIRLQWTYPKEGLENIKGFKLKRSDKFNGVFKEIVSSLLPSDTIATDPSPLNSNYYIISAYDQYGGESSSMPSLAMKEDSIAPVVPVQLKGKIDSLGIVTLTWDKNKEKDLLGYRVYRSNFQNSEFVQVSIHPALAPLYIDTIEIATLTKKVFYKIVAVDTHFNPSDYSKALELERPDIIAPVPPQIESITSNEKGIQLHWIKSSSEDVVKHVLYRRTATEKGWRPIYTTVTNDTLTHYSDEATLPGEQYAYTLVAIDRSGLESAPSRPVSRARMVSYVKKEMKDITAKVDRSNNNISLSWKYEEEGVKKFLIYKANDKEGLVLYKEVNGLERQFVDQDLKINSVYTYRIQASFDNGALSPFSKEINVDY